MLVRERECVLGMCSALSCSALFPWTSCSPRDPPNFICHRLRLQISNHSGFSHGVEILNLGPCVSAFITAFLLAPKWIPFKEMSGFLICFILLPHSAAAWFPMWAAQSEKVKPLKTYQTKFTDTLASLGHSTRLAQVLLPSSSFSYLCDVLSALLPTPKMIPREA